MEEGPMIFRANAVLLEEYDRITTFNGKVP